MGHSWKLIQATLTYRLLWHCRVCLEVLELGVSGFSPRKFWKSNSLNGALWQSWLYIPLWHLRVCLGSRAGLSVLTILVSTCFHKNGCISLNNCPIWKIQKLAYSGDQALSRVAGNGRLGSRQNWSAVGTLGEPWIPLGNLRYEPPIATGLHQQWIYRHAKYAAFGNSSLKVRQSSLTGR